MRDAGKSRIRRPRRSAVVYPSTRSNRGTVVYSTLAGLDRRTAVHRPLPCRLFSGTLPEPVGHLALLGGYHVGLSRRYYPELRTANRHWAITKVITWRDVL